MLRTIPSSCDCPHKWGTTCIAVEIWSTTVSLRTLTSSELMMTCSWRVLIYCNPSTNKLRGRGQTLRYVLNRVQIIYRKAVDLMSITAYDSDTAWVFKGIRGTGICKSAKRISLDLVHRVHNGRVWVLLLQRAQQHDIRYIDIQNLTYNEWKILCNKAK